MARVSDALVSRSRLVPSGVPPTVLIVQGRAGVGKTVVLEAIARDFDGPVCHIRLSELDRFEEAFVARLRHSLKLTGLNDLATALAAPHVSAQRHVDLLGQQLTALDEPVLLAIDGIHHLDVSAADRLTELVGRFPSQHHLVLSTRSLDGPLHRISLLTQHVIDDRQLRFARHETAQLLIDVLGLPLHRKQVGAIHDITAGVPLEVTIAGRFLAQQSDIDTFGDALAQLLDQGDAIQVAVDHAIDTLSRDAKRSWINLASVPWLNTDVADLLAKHLKGTRRAVRAGLTVSRGPGRVGLADPVRHAIAGHGSANHRFLCSAADAYRQTGHLLDGLLLLADNALERQAAQLLLDAAPQQVNDIPAPQLARFVASLSYGVQSSLPQLAVLVARAWRAAGQPERQHEVLDGVEQAGRLPRHANVAVRAERMRDAAFATPDACDAPARMAQRLLDGSRKRAPADVTARLHETLGAIAAVRQAPGWASDADRHLSTAVETFVASGETTSATVAASTLASRVYLPTGRINAATETLDRALVLALGDPVLTLAVLLQRARALVANNAHVRATADLAEARRLARLLGDDDALQLAARIDRTVYTSAIDPAVGRRRKKATATIESSQPTIEIQVLGTFDVRVDGTSAEIRAGLATQLVKVVAVRGGRVHQDEVARALWPDRTAAQTRSRIDGVRYRLGPAVDVVVRHGEFISFAEGSRLDIATFVELAREALTSLKSYGSVDVVAGRTALDFYDELLPGHDDEWVNVARQRLRERSIDVAHAMFVTALQADNLAEAEHWISWIRTTGTDDRGAAETLERQLLSHHSHRRVPEFDRD